MVYENFEGPSSGIITANQNKTSYKWYKSQEEETCHMQEVYSAYLQSSLNKDTAPCFHTTRAKEADWKQRIGPCLYSVVTWAVKAYLGSVFRAKSV